MYNVYETLKYLIYAHNKEGGETFNVDFHLLHLHNA